MKIIFELRAVVIREYDHFIYINFFSPTFLRPITEQLTYLVQSQCKKKRQNPENQRFPYRFA